MTDFTELSLANWADESHEDVTGILAIMPALAGVKLASFVPTSTSCNPTSSTESTSDIDCMSRLQRLQASSPRIPSPDEEELDDEEEVEEEEELKNHDDTLVRAARPRLGASGGSKMLKMQSSY
ncbi:hypothetical protein T484DRAFT_1918275 [Baffinella frigidus]|nr:hypothetical protein T484DRAFT_1918275 [Cryptophyta sp. CCMP2293]